MKKKELLSVFVKFLKDNKAYNGYMRAAKANGWKNVRDVISNPTKEAHDYMFAVKVFTWCRQLEKEGYWSEIHSAWTNYAIDTDLDIIF